MSGPISTHPQIDELPFLMLCCIVENTLYSCYICCYSGQLTVIDFLINQNLYRFYRWTETSWHRVNERNKRLYHLGLEIPVY